MTGSGDPVEAPRDLPGGDEPAEARRDVGVDPSELTLALSPKQIIGGFALLAALVMLLRRRGGDRDRDRRRG